MNKYRVVTIKQQGEDVRFAIQRRYNWVFWEGYLNCNNLGIAIRACKLLEFPVKPPPPIITQVYP